MTKKKFTVVDEDIDDLLGIGSETKVERELGIDELLDEFEDIPTPDKKAKVTTERKPRIVYPNKELPMISFHTKKGQHIVERGTRYWVVRDADGKLHYKEESGVVFLPDDWQIGDPIPKEIMEDLL